MADLERVDFTGSLTFMTLRRANLMRLGVPEELAYLEDHFFEHLPDKRHTMNELWRVLVPGGIARILLPHATQGDGGHCDPTHCSYWTPTDFEYYLKGCPERERFRDSYGIKADFVIENRNAHGHISTVRHERVLGGYVVEFEVVLRAVCK